jgi:hypothetical protein
MGASPLVYARNPPRISNHDNSLLPLNGAYADPPACRRCRRSADAHMSRCAHAQDLGSLLPLVPGRTGATATVPG